VAVTIKEGAKNTIRARVERTQGSGAITLVTPERRIVDVNRALITGFDWAAAAWDGTLNELSALFDSTLSGLIATGTYYMQLRGTIGPERYVTEVKIVLEDIGP
jgi:ABC-type uncharacterized transport system permease subunit